jgi:hypothetical protein
MHSSESWFSEGVRVYQLGSACPTTNNKVGAVLRAASIPNRQRTLPVFDRAFYRELQQQGILPPWLDVETMRLPTDPPPPPELADAELAVFIRDETEPAAWVRLDAGARYLARRLLQRMKLNF